MVKRQDRLPFVVEPKEKAKTLRQQDEADTRHTERERKRKKNRGRCRETKRERRRERDEERETKRRETKRERDKDRETRERGRERERDEKRTRFAFDDETDKKGYGMAKTSDERLSTHARQRQNTSKTRDK